MSYGRRTGRILIVGKLNQDSAIVLTMLVLFVALMWVGTSV
jgi:hypothetical protein